jgi:hypothetical protein
LKKNISRSLLWEKFLELTELMAESVHSKIVTCTQSAKDFSTIAYGTPDFVWNNCLTIRYVDVTKKVTTLKLSNILGVYLYT